MIARAIKLRNAFNLYVLEQGQQERNNKDKEDSIIRDALTTNNWDDLT